MAADVLTAAALATSAVDEIVDQVWNELKAGHNTQGSFGEGHNLAAFGDVTNVGFTPTTTQFESADFTEAAADFYKDSVIVFRTGTGVTDQRRACTASALVVGRTRFTVDALTVAPPNLARFLIV